eukprot:TRINITY_DN3420_c0_g1_i1.p1 TRINITY_DN3420_c0_g1~~TRINITY_DN3420_c0_g1_i1.p1  ORF type:complete len:292 (-),score=81.15 TRINITY_DN3420_c0_g1_i1:12-887(-)
MLTRLTSNYKQITHHKLTKKANFTRKQSSSQYISVSEWNGHDSILKVSMDRPEVHNAFDEFFISELTRVFKEIDTREDVRAVVFTSQGASFSAGADLNWMKKMVEYTKEENVQDSLKLFDMVYAIKDMKVPVIGRINGHALGGGSGLVSACDFAFSSSKAKFGFTEVKLGIIPAVISPFVMDKIGNKASQYFLTGERFPAPVAKEIGLIRDHFETEEELDNAVENSVKEILNSSPQAIRASKRLIKEISPIDIYSHRDFVANEIATIRTSPEGQEGLSSFLNKRKPNWIKN